MAYKVYTQTVHAWVWDGLDMFGAPVVRVTARLRRNDCIAVESKRPVLEQGAAGYADIVGLMTVGAIGD